MAIFLLAGSERQPVPGARAIGKANAAERFEVSIIVRRRAAQQFAQRIDAVAEGKTATRVKRDAYREQFGADPADILAVKQFATNAGLTVAHEDPVRRTVVLSGSVAEFTQAFGVELETFEHANGTYRGRTGEVQLPSELRDIVVAVLGLDNRRQAQPHFRVRRPPEKVVWHSTADAAPAVERPFTPTELAAVYEFPAGTGAGQCIGLIELGGGYRPADLATYFSKLGVTAPEVVAVSVDHAANNPTGDANGPDGEVLLDIEVAGAIAPGAKIAVYFAPNTDAGFLDAITTAVHDTVNNPSVISISWGSAESNWTQQAMTAFDAAFQSAAALGITVCVASGDNGSTDGLPQGNHVDFPASSPYALACGGSRLQVEASQIASEVVWNDGERGGATGGGESGYFALPAWQAGLTKQIEGRSEPLANRGVPDVCGDADPETGYEVIVDGVAMTIGGTSAVAPLWAALIARINAMNTTTAGYVNPRLYGKPAALNDITQGNNGAFSAASGWDACTGLGSPKGTAVAQVV